ncbi:1050_t:CDS:10, partial [Dentiscutata heterogama]
MPDLGHQIKDFKYYTWHVTDWRNLERKLTSPEFEAGSWKWRLLLFPFGNFNYDENSTDNIAVYLDFVDTQEAYNGWHICVQFALLLWNPEEPTKFISQHTYHLFTADELDWGFAKFYDRNKLFITSDERTRPLIENDSCNITVLVRILENPTEYMYLNNQGINTFLNSVIHSLYHIKYFRKAVYQIPMKDYNSVRSISSALQWTFYQLNVSDAPVKTTELIKFFGWNKFFIKDVREFFKILRDDLEDKLKHTKVDGAISKLFAGTIKTWIKCVNVNCESLRAEDYYDIQLDIRGCKTLDDSFMKYIQEETLEDDNKYDAEGYGLQVAKKRVIFESFPPVLHLHLNRFEYDVHSNNTVKLNNRYEIPIEIDLQKYLSPDADKSQSYKYLLHGVLVRDDDNDCEEDRYFAFLKPEKSNRWIKFDDRVTPASINYGYEGLLQSKNAYMLIYIRESNIDEILTPISSEDMPIHLRSRLDDENAAYKQINENLKENNPYLQTWIVTENIVRNHKGFGLVNFDNQKYPLSEIPQFKILKEDTYGTFKKMIATKYKIPTDRIRFWTIINRQNKTVRLHEPINDDYLDKSMDEIKKKMKRCNELRLYMEILGNTINFKKGCLQTGAIIIFIKYFNPDSESLENLGQLYVQKKEITPHMIKKIVPKFTFIKSNIQNGDIICFQKALNNKEIEKYTLAGRINNIPQFYELLLENVIVRFKSKFGYRDPIPEFDLVLNKNMPYEVVANHVATYLNVDSSRLRFTLIDSSANKGEINRTTNQTLSEILQFSEDLYYE